MTFGTTLVYMLRGIVGFLPSFLFIESILICTGIVS